MIKKQLLLCTLATILVLPTVCNAANNANTKKNDTQEKTIPNNSSKNQAPTIVKATLDMNKAAVDIHQDQISKLTLTAQGTIKIPPDELRLKVGVVTLSDTAGHALEDNSAKMLAIGKALQDTGLSRSDFETGHFAIHPTYTPYPKDAPADWQPSINGYEATNSMIIHTDKLDLAGKLIDAANKAGANAIEDINFGLHEPHDHWYEAITRATENAIKDADVMARTAGIELVRIVSITLENTYDNVQPITPRNFSQTKIGSFSVISPIVPGMVSLTASVSIVYEIASK